MNSQRVASPRAVRCLKLNPPMGWKVKTVMTEKSEKPKLGLVEEIPAEIENEKSRARTDRRSDGG